MDNQAFEMGEDVSRLLKLNLLKNVPINRALTKKLLQHKVSTSYNRMAAGRPQMGRRMTHEAIPTVTNYSNMFMLSKTNVRPTVEELHESDLNDMVKVHY